MHRTNSKLKQLAFASLVFGSGLLAGCDKPIGMGNINNLVVAAPDSVWEVLRPEIEATLEPSSFTVRDERIFQVAHVNPTNEEWGRLRLIRKLLVIGEPADPWIVDALAEHDGAAPAAPAVFQVRNVWAQGQVVTVLLLPPGSGPAAAAPLLPEIGSLLVEQLTSGARARMFVTGADTALAASLRQTAGFTILVPMVYDVAEPQPGVYVFRNDNPDPSQLIREVVVAARPSDEVPFTPAAALEWRAQLARELHDPAQLTDSTLVEAREVPLGEQRALQVQGTWLNEPGGWPAGGPFITRLVRCPASNRTYLLDSWLYAPGEPKFEFMVQLETIARSFSCAP